MNVSATTCGPSIRQKEVIVADSPQVLIFRNAMLPRSETFNPRASKSS